jgi:hypothetical protein
MSQLFLILYFFYLWNFGFYHENHQEEENCYKGFHYGNDDEDLKIHDDEFFHENEDK